MLTLKRLLGAGLTALMLLLTACQSPLNITQNHAAARDVTLSGSAGTISVTNMTNTSLTVTYSPGTQYTSVQLYLSQGNGTGLVLAAQNMNFSAGTYSYTFSNASYTSGALIYVALEQNNNGVETTLPSGSLSNVATWMSFTYAAATPTPTASPTPTPASSGLTVSGANGSLEMSNMTGGNLTVTYAPSASISSAALYVSQGNGTGLVVANQSMTNTSGTWTATCSNASFTSGAVIYVDVLTTANGVQTSVPQGSLSNVTSWASFTYGSAAPSPSPSPTPSPTPGNLTVSGVNGTLTLTNMTGSNLTVSYASSSAISSAFLYVSQGNGTGLVVANSAMTNTNGTWSATCNNATFVAGAQIYVDVLVTANGVQTNVPQGSLSNVTSWGSFTYAAPAPTPTPSPTPTPTPSPTPAPITSTGDPWYGGQLLWDDEFNGPTIDPTKWTFDTGAGGWGNNELETYTTSNASIQNVADGSSTDSCLVITAQKDAQGNWTSARLKTLGLQSFTYGKIEARMKLPSGNGMWPAFWMMGTNQNSVGWPACGETDIMEMIGGTGVSPSGATLSDSTVYGTLHWLSSATNAAASTQPEVYTLPSGKFSDAFHTFGVVWTPTSITYYVDGVQTGSVTPDSTTGTTFQNPYYLLLNLAVGGNWPGNPTASTVSPQSLDVDWVRVYAAPGTNTSYTLSFDTQGGTPSASSVSVPSGTTLGAAGVTFPTATKTGYNLVGWFSAANGGGTAITSSTVLTGNLTAYADWAPAGPVNFGPNVLIMDPSMSASTIQSQVDAVYASQKTNQFGSQRYAIMFKPGTYNVNVNVGYYTQILGLGQSPDATQIMGSIQADGSYDPNMNVTNNFWRGAENIAVTPTNGTDMWAVSQACPLRRVHVKGGLWLFDINPNTGASGWASGGFMGDTLVDGQVNSGGQQQWLSRNSQWSSWNGSVWNMVFVGDVNAPATTFPNPPNTTVTQTPVVKEKPYLYIDSSGNYNVFVPSLRSASQGVSWLNGNTPGTSIPISQFYVAQASTDTAATLNAALAAGKNLLLTPGVYSLNDTLRVTNPNTIVLGIGLATLLNTTQAPAMTVADVDGVEIAGILFDAGPGSPYQLQVGPAGSSANHAANPILLSDLFFRVGGAAPGSTTESLEINSNNVIGDDFWIWRADHGSSSANVGWTVNPADHGLVVNGQNVTIYGLAVEHYQKEQTLWNGNGGQVYFYQSEEPYDVPTQADWMDGSEYGYPSYKVADTVTSHLAMGLGVYCFFNVNPSVQLTNALEVPSPLLSSMQDLTTVSLGGTGTIDHLINGLGPAANSSSNIQTYN